MLTIATTMDIRAWCASDISSPSISTSANGQSTYGTGVAGRKSNSSTILVPRSRTVAMYWRFLVKDRVITSRQRVSNTGLESDNPSWRPHRSIRRAISYNKQALAAGKLLTEYSWPNVNINLKRYSLWNVRTPTDWSLNSEVNEFI